jgi:predicted phage gp36 major capsid-like protein
MPTKYLTTRTTGPGLKEVSTVQTSAGASDANKIPNLDASGRLDISFMPTGVGAATFAAVASEALVSGDFVQLFNNAGTANVRKANAGASQQEANGFVTAGVASAASATVFYGDLNAALTGLTVGAHYYLSNTTPGAVTATQPAAATHLVQHLGKALNATTLVVDIDDEFIELA